MGVWNLTRCKNMLYYKLLMLAVKKPKNKKRLFPILAVAGLLLVGGAVGYVLIAKPFSKNSATPAVTTNGVNTVNYDPPTSEEKTAADQRKEDIVKQQEQTNLPTTTPTIIISPTRISQAGAGQPLNIRVFIDGTASGQCQVTITKAGQPTINKSFSISFEATSSVCQNADVPIGEFGSEGDWTVRLIAVSGQAQSKPYEQTVSIKK